MEDRVTESSCWAHGHMGSGRCTRALRPDVCAPRVGQAHDDRDAPFLHCTLRTALCYVVQDESTLFGSGSPDLLGDGASLVLAAQYSTPTWTNVSVSVSEPHLTRYHPSPPLTA